MEEYLKTLLEQIRCKKARGMVEREIRSHIEEQATCNQSHGMAEDEALREAVRDMGDPVEAGVALDRIHRPKPAWDMITVMALISLASILIHVLIGLGAEEVGGYTGTAYIKRTVAQICLGFILMLAVYRMDYSFFGKYAKWIAGIFLILMGSQIFWFGTLVHGARRIQIGPFSLSAVYLMLLYVPLYGAILYSYRGSGYKGILKAMVWMLLPAWLVRHIPNMSNSLMLVFMMSVLLSVAVWKGWFIAAGKKFLAIYWSVFILLPAFCLFAGFKLQWFAVYQTERILAFINMRGGDSSYILTLLRKYMMECKFFGGSGKEIIGYLPEYNSDYILTFLASYYGIAAVLVIACLLVFVSVRAFHISTRQKNQLGMMMGCGCGLVFAVNVFVNIVENFGLLPTTQTFLPFISSGGTAIIVCYILAGIVLSVYRHKNILPTVTFLHESNTGKPHT